MFQQDRCQPIDSTPLTTPTAPCSQATHRPTRWQRRRDAARCGVCLGPGGTPDRSKTNAEALAVLQAQLIEGQVDAIDLNLGAAPLSLCPALEPSACITAPLALVPASLLPVLARPPPSTHGAARGTRPQLYLSLPTGQHIDACPAPPCLTAASLPLLRNGHYSESPWTPPPLPSRLQAARSGLRGESTSAQRS